MPQGLSQLVMEVADPSHAGQVRRAAVECAESLGLGESDRGAIAIAVTEMATNLVKHARGRQNHLRTHRPQWEPRPTSCIHRQGSGNS